MVRGLRSGLPISETIGIVADELPDPVGTEFRAVSDKMRIGRTMDAALQETSDRLGTSEFQFYVISLAIQRETGGNLAETLSNLAEALRKRSQMKLKIRAMSSESKASAYIIGALPFIVFGLISDVFLTADNIESVLAASAVLIVLAIGQTFAVATAGIDLSKQTLLTISVTEDEIDGIGGENIQGAYACMKYFQSLDNPNNKTCVPAFKKMWGEKTVIGDVTQAAYLGPWLWKMACEKAGSFDVDKVVAASPGLEFKNAPEGYVKVHQNHHLWSNTLIGQGQPDGQFKVVYKSDLIEPNPFPKGYQ